ncbi:hypothetical protein MYOV065v1_p0023 [Vibrio phage PS15B.2]|nr:hypothetical protein MYOV065v1_p0023 [Vibrio phage PS15B.2]QZI90839.1 hypothetical protein MYOV066v1_p0061 [Vibrio phage PS15B.3]QZI90873.1 hypothetical protein MYOV064v1_p0023 [Vibrio phage PS15B.4]
MKHKHYEMIVAKAANMELVVFAKSLKWHKVDSEDFQFFNQHEEYFLCLPQHKEACLHWLNGGGAQYLSNGMSKWIDFGDSKSWSITHLFMTDECELRIKPKKEKRWLRYNSKGVFQDEYIKKPDCANKGDQFIEIEVEV